MISEKRRFTFRRYVTCSAFGHSAWEILHSPLYRGWMPSLISETPLLLARCVIIDALLALAALSLAVWFTGNSGWPDAGYWTAGGRAIALGVVLAVLAEWLNVYLLGTWNYSPPMPVVPFLNVGVSPLLQWVLVPGLSLWWARPKGLPD